MDRFLWVCLGSAVGGGARYLLSVHLLKVLGPGFPYGTLTVNVIGSFLLAVVLYAGAETAAISPTLCLALGAGVMGGFTTYSAFSFDTLRYIQTEAWGLLFAYLCASVIGCLLACWLGWLGAKAVFGT